MIIRNKFNGYGFDGARLYHDPISLSIAATQAAAASSAAAVAATAAPTLAATTAAAAAPTLAASALPGIVGGATAPGAFGAGITSGLGGSTALPGMVGAETLAAASPEIAANLAAAGNTGIMSSMGSTLPAAGAPATQIAGATTLPPAGGTPFTPPTAAGPLPPAGGTPPIDPNSAQYLQQQYPEAYKAAAQNTPQTGAATQRAVSDPTISNAGFSKSYTTSPYDFTTGPTNGLTTQPGMADALGAGTAPGGAPYTGTPFTSQVPFQQPGLKVTPDMATNFGTPPPQNALAKGFETGLQYVKDNPISTGMGLMSAGQYMNKPEEEDKDKYKSTVDMSGFQPSTPTQRPFTRSYEYQGYAVGGPVEQMSAMNAVGANTGYPMAGINTPIYSNPMMQRPEATNVVAPSADTGVGAYTGEARFAEGGLSAAERREYGLQTRGQRASRNLSKSYEEMEEARQREAMKLFNESSLPPATPIRRSRTQELSSPFSAAMAEHARLGKKAKVPVVEMPKTNLGDIDNYMDIPIEAAGGGIMHGLGGYSDGGRLLKGPGDGVSDSIPAVIGKRQPARLADGEFVVPARIVSELGNGSTEAGARKLYAMMERVQKARKKSIGKKKVAVNSKSDKHLPA